MSSQDTTNDRIADLATETARLDRLALIGIFGSTNAPGALLRVPGGRIERVELGDRVAGGVVAAIGDDRLVLHRNGRARVLKLPHS